MSETRHSDRLQLPETAEDMLAWFDKRCRWYQAELDALRADLARVRAERDKAQQESEGRLARLHSLHDEKNTEWRRAEQAEAERDSLRLELAASESNRIKGNEYLLGHARALREALEAISRELHVDNERDVHESCIRIDEIVDAVLAATQEEPTP